MANLLIAKKYHFLYKTTNIINNRYYYGMHSTNVLEDGYIGSGKRLWYEVRKYGKESFKCEILEFFEDREALAKAESELITSQEITKEECLNLVTGGQGGFTLEQSKKGRQIVDEILKRKYGSNFREVINKQYRESLSELDKKSIAEKIKKGQEAAVKRGWRRHSRLGVRTSEETKQKVRKTRENSGANTSERNSQYGTYWVCDGEQNRKLKRGEKLPDGWYEGRVLKKDRGEVRLEFCGICKKEIPRKDTQKNCYCRECLNFLRYRNFFCRLGINEENLTAASLKAYQLITSYIESKESYTGISKKHNISINSIVNFLKKFKQLN